MVVVMRVRTMGVIGADRELMMNVEAVLEVAELLVETPSLHIVLDSVQPFILMLNFGDDGAPIYFELVVLFVVAVCHCLSMRKNCSTPRTAAHATSSGIVSHMMPASSTTHASAKALVAFPL